MRLLSILLFICLAICVTAAAVFSKRVLPKITRSTVVISGEKADQSSRPLYRRVPASTADLPSGCGGTSLAGSSFRTFGHYNSFTGEAVQGRVWTFDHGDIDPFEGWESDDLTTNDFTAFRHITQAIWTGHGNVPSAPIISGSGSVWMGFFEDEADNECWKAGLGYGNNWRQNLISPLFYNASGMVYISFDYFYDAETYYDYIRVLLDRGSSLDTLLELTGTGGSPSSPLNFNQGVDVSGYFNIGIEFGSDYSYSDEDSLYETYLSAFGVDDINLVGIDGVGGPSPPYRFETGLDGWTAGPIPGVGSYADVNDVSGYTLLDSDCRLDENVVSFHDGLKQHAAWQYERFISNRVDISAYGTELLNVFAQYDLYVDLPSTDKVYWTWGFTYYPYICTVTGDSIWSPPAGTPYWFYDGTPNCERIRSFANDTSSPGKYASGTILVPAGSDSVRFFVDVRCDSSGVSGNASPLIDNIYIGVSVQSTVIHVPSPAYPHIQAGINAAGPGDTVLVATGVYTGDGNRNLDFGGKSIVLISEEGPDSSIIDCQLAGRGFYFHSHETGSAVVDGFTITGGDTLIVGNAIRVGPTTSSPTIRNCKVVNNRVGGDDRSVILVSIGNPLFECCTVALDTITVSGGVIRVTGGGPVFNHCDIIENAANTNCIELLGGSPYFTACNIESNTKALNAVLVGTAATFFNSSISYNSGTGMYFWSVGTSTVDTCQIASNGGTGIVLEANSSVFNYCDIMQNSNSGIIITNVLTAASSGARGSAAAALAGTAPQFNDCNIKGNVNTSSSGGGILFDCSNVPVTAFTPAYTNCTITGNSSVINGGGVAVCGYAVFTDIAPIFLNCTIASNNAGVNGGGFYVGVTPGGVGGGLGIVTADNTILWGNCSSGAGHQAYTEAKNVVAFDCSDVDSTGIRGAGEIEYTARKTFLDPSFCQGVECDPGGTIAGDFSLYMNSPADSLASPCGKLIGAHPVVCQPPTGAKESTPGPSETTLWPNTPNPFNPSTTIRFDLARSGRVTLRIYDVTGRLVRTLIDQVLPADRHTVVWDGTDDRGQPVATGVYFDRLSTSNEARTRKLVLIK